MVVLTDNFTNLLQIVQLLHKRQHCYVNPIR
jgi:hypothetical protein